MVVSERRERGGRELSLDEQLLLLGELQVRLVVLEGLQVGDELGLVVEEDRGNVLRLVRVGHEDLEDVEGPEAARAS